MARGSELCKNCGDYIHGVEKYHKCVQLEYRIQDYDGDGEWNTMWSTDNRWCNIAGKIGNDHWAQDPCNPGEVHTEVWIKHFISN